MRKHQMRRNMLFFFVLFFSLLVELTRAQNNRRTEAHVGVVTDVGTSYSAMLCINNFSLADFYSSRPQLQTRLVINIGDSIHDVVGAAALSPWKDHLTQTIWLGVRDSVPKEWEDPTNGKRLRMGIPKRTGFTDLVKVTRDPITNSTLVTDFFEAIIREMPYDVSYEFVSFEKRNGKAAGNYKDLVHQVYLGRYDAVVGATTIPANRSSYVGFTFPFIKGDNISFLRPLSWQLWLTSFFFFFINCLTVWALEHRVNPDFRGPPNFRNRKKPIKKRRL